MDLFSKCFILPLLFADYLLLIVQCSSIPVYVTCAQRLQSLHGGGGQDCASWTVPTAEIVLLVP